MRFHAPVNPPDGLISFGFSTHPFKGLVSSCLVLCGCTLRGWRHLQNLPCLCCPKSESLCAAASRTIESAMLTDMANTESLRDNPHTNKKAGACAPAFSVCAAQEAQRLCVALGRVVHIELNRVRCHFIAHDLFPLQFHVPIDLVVGEHAALLEEVAVRVQRVKSFAQ